MLLSLFLALLVQLIPMYYYTILDLVEEKTVMMLLMIPLALTLAKLAIYSQQKIVFTDMT